MRRDLRLAEDPARRHGEGEDAVVSLLRTRRARRLQIQERLTRQIADAVSEHLDARGAAVIVKAHHLCMGCRGVKLPGTEMITSAMLGTLRDDAVTRGEFLRLAGAGN